MSRAERDESSRVLWEAGEEAYDAQREALDYLARRLRFRHRTLERMSTSKKSEYLARCAAPPPDVIQAALLWLHIGPRKQMLAAFLNRLGVPHQDGLTDGEFDPPERDALDAALKELRTVFPDDHVRLYVNVLLAQNAERWGGLEGLLDEAETPEAEETLEQESEREPEPTIRLGEKFDQLDIVLIKTIVASAAGGEGALNEDQVRDLVEEVRHLNQDRHRSYFHLGFLDVLQGRELDTKWPESNDDRRAWYLCGALSGLVRRGDKESARALIDAYPAEFALLGSGRHPGASLVVEIIFDVVWSGAEPGSVTQIVEPMGLAKAGFIALTTVLDAATERTRANRGQEAQPLLDLVFQAATMLRHLEKQELPEPFLHDLRRRQAHAARLGGAFEEARGILEGLLREGAGYHEAMIRADIGLIECRLRALSDVRLPDSRADWGEAAAALAPGLKWFEEAAQGEMPYGAHGEFCLGVHRVLTGEPDEALPVLERAVAEMQQRPKIYTPLRILPRARLYLAYCLAESLNPTLAQRGVELVERALEGLGSETRYLYADIIRGTALVDQESAVAMARRLFETVGEAAIDAIGEAEIMREMPEVRDALCARAADESRTRAKRFDDYARLLRAAVRASDAGGAEEALGGLEELADDEPERSRFLEILEDPDRHGGVWNAEERVDTQTRLLEAVGDVEKAKALLEPIGHQYLTQENVPAAAGIVERIRSWGLEPDARLVARLEAVGAEDEPPPPATVEGSVLFIGGDETQRNCAGHVEDWVAEKWPGIRISFEHPCWSSNWGRQLDGLKSRIAQAHVVVLMPYVRTQFGRQVRKLCGKNGIAWVACTGKGRATMRASVQVAIEVLAKA